MSTFKSERKIKLAYFKAIVIAILLPVGYIYFWFLLSPSTINEFLLLTNKVQIANGYIIHAEELEDYVDTNNDRSIEKKLDYNFEYTFTLPDGKVIKSFGSEAGALPEILSNIQSHPYPVKVEYLSNNPKVNRIKASWTGEQNLWKWFQHKVLLGLLGLLFFCYLSYLFFKDGRKNYNCDISIYIKSVQD